MTQPVFRLSVQPYREIPPLKAEAGTGTSTCACCGLPDSGVSFSWRGTDTRICHVCNLLQSLNRPTIDREALLIWCPELDQRQVSALAAHAHLALYRASGRKPSAWEQSVTVLAEGREPGMLPAAGVAAAQTLRTLFARSDEAFRRLQSSAPSHVSIAMQIADISRQDVKDGLVFLLDNRECPIFCV